MANTSSIPPVVVVPVKSAWYSKINWTQAIAMVAMAGTVFNLFDWTPAQQVEILAGITTIQSGVTWLWKTFFTTTVTPASIPPSTVMRE